MWYTVPSREPPAAPRDLPAAPSAVASGPPLPRNRKKKRLEKIDAGHLPKKLRPARHRLPRELVHLDVVPQKLREPRDLVHAQPVVLRRGENEPPSQVLVRDQELRAVRDGVREVQLRPVAAGLGERDQVLEARPLELALVVEQHLKQALAKARVAVDALLRQERANHEREALGDANGVLIHELVERGGYGSKVEIRERRGSTRANVGVERRGRGLKATDGRRETTAKVLKDRRSPRQRGRMGTSVNQNAPRVLPDVLQRRHDRSDVRAGG
eukprot:30738-Pelagococcus_subviridis.AAC.4